MSYSNFFASKYWYLVNNINANFDTMRTAGILVEAGETADVSDYDVIGFYSLAGANGLATVTPKYGNTISNFFLHVKIFYPINISSISPNSNVLVLYKEP